MNHYIDIALQFLAAHWEVIPVALLAWAKAYKDGGRKAAFEAALTAVVDAVEGAPQTEAVAAIKQAASQNAHNAGVEHAVLAPVVRRVSARKSASKVVAVEKP